MNLAEVVPRAKATLPHIPGTGADTFLSAILERLTVVISVTAPGSIQAPVSMGDSVTPAEASVLRQGISAEKDREMLGHSGGVPNAFRNEVEEDDEGLFDLPSLRGGFWRDSRAKEGFAKCFVVPQRQPGL
jgi:hypothetical protein